jgi:hypothetical protein
MENLKMKLLQALAIFVLLTTPLAQEQSPKQWFGVGLGFTGLEVETGAYDLVAPTINGRILLGWPFGAGFNLGADVLWMPGSRTEVYTGLGLRLRGDFSSSDTLWFGPAVSLGYDAALTQQDSLYINAGLGLLFPIYYTPAFPDVTELVVLAQIASLELGIGYKYKF